MNFDKGLVFDEVTSIVAKHFLDPAFDEEKWNRVAQEYRVNAVTAKTLDDYSSEVNALLKTLDTSHTYYFSRHDPRRYQILGVFHRLYDATHRDLFRVFRNWHQYPDR